MKTVREKSPAPKTPATTSTQQSIDSLMDRWERDKSTDPGIFISRSAGRVRATGAALAVLQAVGARLGLDVQDAFTSPDLDKSEIARARSRHAPPGLPTINPSGIEAVFCSEVETLGSLGKEVLAYDIDGKLWLWNPLDYWKPVDLAAAAKWYAEVSKAGDRLGLQVLQPGSQVARFFQDIASALEGSK